MALPTLLLAFSPSEATTLLGSYDSPLMVDGCNTTFDATDNKRVLLQIAGITRAFLNMSGFYVFTGDGGSSDVPIFAPDNSDFWIGVNATHEILVQVGSQIAGNISSAGVRHIASVLAATLYADRVRANPYPTHPDDNPVIWDFSVPGSIDMADQEMSSVGTLQGQAGAGNPLVFDAVAGPIGVELNSQFTKLTLGTDGWATTTGHCDVGRIDNIVPSNTLRVFNPDGNSLVFRAGTSGFEVTSATKILRSWLTGMTVDFVAGTPAIQTRTATTSSTTGLAIGSNCAGTLMNQFRMTYTYLTPSLIHATVSTWEYITTTSTASCIIINLSYPPAITDYGGYAMTRIAYGASGAQVSRFYFGTGTDITIDTIYDQNIAVSSGQNVINGGFSTYWLTSLP